MNHKKPVSQTLLFYLLTITYDTRKPGMGAEEITHKSSNKQQSTVKVSDFLVSFYKKITFVALSTELLENVREVLFESIESSRP